MIPVRSAEKIDFIRRFALAMSAGRELNMELAITNLMKQLKT